MKKPKARQILAHNLCWVIQSMYELGIDIDIGAPVE
jgi:hypothetical protein